MEFQTRCFGGVRNESRPTRTSSDCAPSTCCIRPPRRPDADTDGGGLSAGAEAPPVGSWIRDVGGGYSNIVLLMNSTGA